MVNLNECKFGDRLVTKEGKNVVYLGHNVIFSSLPKKDKDDIIITHYHVIAGKYDKGWFYLARYTDNGILLDHDSRVCGA